MEGVKGCRVVALNLGAKNLDQAIKFWEACFGAPFEDAGDRTSKQLRLGTDDEFFLFNMRARAVDEPHYGHVTAFGLLVDDVDDFHRRALAAGAEEHVPPTDHPGLPRHSRFEDPSANRVVLWQG
jgi:predicted enzyme related to lactoylglutathione lyase